jgi:hypothetical protein
MNHHVETPLLRAYASGEVDAAHAFSVEAHVVGCAHCQAEVSALVPRLRLDAGWAEIEDRLDAPPRGVVERTLARAGVAPHVARLLGTTPSLRASWLTALAVTLAVVVLGAPDGDRGLFVFLCVAALAPVVGVAAAFGPGLDPTHEIALAAPASSVRLVLLRTVAVLVTTGVITAAAAMALPGVGWSAAAWLLPALGLTLASLALATWIAPLHAFAAVTALWIVAVGVRAAGPGDVLSAFGAGAQLSSLAVMAAAAAVLVHRRERLEVR